LWGCRTQPAQKEGPAQPDPAPTDNHADACCSALLTLRPLRSACAQLLLSSSLNPEQRELADTILESCNSLLGVLGDILDFSKLVSMGGCAGGGVVGAAWVGNQPDQAVN